MLTRPYRAVLFDFFGTLTQAVRRGPAHTAVARRLGCDPSMLRDVLDATFRARASGTYRSPVTALRDAALAAGGRPGPRELRVAVDVRVLAVRADTRLRPEAVPVLRAVRARGLRTGLVSDCSYELPRFLPSLPVAPLLDACVYSVEVGACKPDPAIYLTACDRLGVVPEDCLYIGDGDSRELTGARAVGMDAVRLATPDLSRHLRLDPDLGWDGPELGSLSDVLPLLASDLSRVVAA